MKSKSYAPLFLMMMVLLLLNTAVVSATFSFTNYDKVIAGDTKYGSIEIWDGNIIMPDEKIATYTLDENSEKCMITCYAKGTISIEKDTKLFDDMKFYYGDVSEYKIKLLDRIVETEVPTYKDNCTTKTDINGTKYDECKKIQNGTMIVKEEVYTDYKDEILPAGNYTWRIEGKKDAYDNVDWVGVSNGVDMETWASWNSSFAEGLRYYWGFNEAVGGTTCADNVSENTMLLQSNTMLNVSGKNGNGLWIGGTNYNATATNNISTGGDTGEFSISFWFKDIWVNYETILGVGLDGAQPFANGEFQILTGGDANKIGARIATSNSENMLAGATNGVWEHYVFTVKNGTVMKGYMNGTNLGNSSGVITFTNFDTTEFFRIFGVVSGFATPVNQGIDELAIWNRSLTASEVLDLYN